MSDAEQFYRKYHGYGIEIKLYGEDHDIIRMMSEFETKTLLKKTYKKKEKPLNRFITQEDIELAIKAIERVQRLEQNTAITQNLKLNIQERDSAVRNVKRLEISKRAFENIIHLTIKA